MSSSRSHWPDGPSRWVVAPHRGPRPATRNCRAIRPSRLEPTSNRRRHLHAYAEKSPVEISTPLAVALHVVVLLLPALLTGRFGLIVSDVHACVFLIAASGLCLVDLTRDKEGSPLDHLPALARERYLCLASGMALLILFWVGLWHQRPGMSPSSCYVLLVGVSMMAGGAAVRLAAIGSLGPRFVSHLRPTSPNVLARTGIYAVTRHPSETGLLVAALGAAVVLQSLAAAIWWATVLVPLSCRRVSREEQMLLAVFGPGYEQYCRVVPKWLPVSLKRTLPNPGT